MKKSEMIGFKTTPEIRKKLEEIAKNEDRSISYIINKIIEKEILKKGDEQNENREYN